jgi:nucleoside-diphosphate-sugar epimerase
MDTTYSSDGYRNVRVAVLGASGFIGRWVAHALCRQGARVALIVRDRLATEEVCSDFRIEGEVVETDLRDSYAIRNLLDVINPSIAFNLAAYGVDSSERDEAAAYLINARLVESVCITMASQTHSNWAGQQLVHAGSALEYGAIGGNLSEDSTPRPTTLYGKSKLAGTRFVTRSCRDLGLSAITARLFTVYGPGERPARLLPSLLRTAKSGNVLHLTSGSQRRDFTYVQDVAEGLLRLGLTTESRGEVVNLATGRLTSVREFAETAARILDIPEERLRFGSIPIREEEMVHSEVSLARLRRMNGWTPTTSIADGIRQTLEHGTARAAYAKKTKIRALHLGPAGILES